VAISQLRPAAARAIPDAALRNNGHRAPAEESPPAPFSKPFTEVLSLAIDGGHISVRRAASLVDMTVDELDSLFAEHGVRSTVDL
jgi:hypothetical protein